MTTASMVIAATLVVVVYSLWVRRHTWWSRWEAGASFAIALEGCGLLLMSPWASALGSPLHDIVQRWNVQHLLGHLCLILALTAIIYHGLLRLADADQVRALFRRHITGPLAIGVAMLVAVFVVADERYHADLFSAHVNDVWLAAYWLVLGGLVIYLFGYTVRCLLIVRTDPRAKSTVDLYLVSIALGAVAVAIQLGTAWAGIDVALPVWFCVGLAISVFAYGSARSWRAKIEWFTAGDRPPSETRPPQPRD